MKHSEFGVPAGYVMSQAELNQLSKNGSLSLETGARLLPEEELEGRGQDTHLFHAGSSGKPHTAHAGCSLISS
jgi:hypothetical protein